MTLILGGVVAVLLLPTLRHVGLHLGLVPAATALLVSYSRLSASLTVRPSQPVALGRGGGAAFDLDRSLGVIRPDAKRAWLIPAIRSISQEN
ncbi:hypothetical protein [Methylobacterium oryzae]|uniref:hypothetical protein n=1 Tax=Methylobacterium oryzae TaxID=334852 RepID=UPI002F352277